MLTVLTVIAWGGSLLALFCGVGWSLTLRRLDRETGRAEKLEQLLQAEVKRAGDLLTMNYQLAVWNEELWVALALAQRMSAGRRVPLSWN